MARALAHRWRTEGRGEGGRGSKLTHGEPAGMGSTTEGRRAGDGGMYMEIGGRGQGQQADKRGQAGRSRGSRADARRVGEEGRR